MECTIFALNVLIIRIPNFNYLIGSNSWNERIFEIDNHSNRSNGQVLLSLIFSCYTVSRSYYQLLMERYVACNLQSAWNEFNTPEGPRVPLTPLIRLAVEPGLAIVMALQSFHCLAATTH